MLARDWMLIGGAIALTPTGAAPVPTATVPTTLLLNAANVSKAAIEPLVPICARVAGVEVQAEYANNPAVAKAIADGARFDVVVIETRMLADLADRGLVGRTSMRALASLPMALATREQGPYSRIDTVANFKRTLLRARSIGYVVTGIAARSSSRSSIN